MPYSITRKERVKHELPQIKPKKSDTKDWGRIHRNFCILMYHFYLVKRNVSLVYIDLQTGKDDKQFMHESINW